MTLAGPARRSRMAAGEGAGRAGRRGSGGGRGNGGKERMWWVGGAVQAADGLAVLGPGARMGAATVYL